MESKAKEIGFKNSGRLGAVKNLGLSLRLPGFDAKGTQGLPEPSYRISEDYRNHLIEMEQQKERARTEAQRLQFNR
jgi:hypothetical protein